MRSPFVIIKPGVVFVKPYFYRVMGGSDIEFVYRCGIENVTMGLHGKVKVAENCDLHGAPSRT